MQETLARWLAHEAGRTRAHANGKNGVEPEKAASEKGNVMTWGDYVEWAICNTLHRNERDPSGREPRGDGVGSASRVMGRMGALGVAVHRVRGGIWGAIADSDRPSREQGQQDHTRM